MSKRNWKILYHNYQGMEQRAVELLYKEMGALILRDAGRYTVHVLPCEQAQGAVLDRHAVVVGLYEESPLIRRYLAAEEIQENGYVIKVMDNPERPEFKLVLITARTPSGLFYGAVDFVDDYFTVAAPLHGGLKLVHEVFEQALPDYYRASSPAFRTRSVFTWGHPINDFRNYIENMARLKLNQLIIWNDYLPLNAKEVADYAHSYGIELIWGYAWGWSRKCDRTKIGSLEQIEQEVLEKYEQVYRHAGGDGIYFQSFTETAEDRIEGQLIAERVTDFVNRIAQKLLERDPGLKLQFGLHATSVREHLAYLAKVDPRVEIMWEDCGSFPYGYHPLIRPKDNFEETVAFTEKILPLRRAGSTALLFKGFMTLDWVGDRFVHQAGPYVMGNSPALAEQDKALLRPIWRQFQSGWLQNGKYAYTVAKLIREQSAPDTTMGMAGQFAGGIWLPEALCAEIFWSCDQPYEEIFDRVTRRKCIDIV